jgi:hypothetical protein
MWIFECTDVFEVVQIGAIIHNVHLIPFFDTLSSATDSLKARRDEYSFQRYLLNCYIDRYSFLKFS